MLRIITTLLIGFISGIMGGALGLGGSVFMLPLLLLSNIIPDYKQLVGTLLFSLLPPISLLAVIEFGRRKQIDYLIGTILFITYFFGAYYGSFINAQYSTRSLIYVSSLVLFSVSIILFYIAFFSK
jgi:uncharacterized membrane protein YfcA